LISTESGDSIRAVINVKTLSDDDYINNNYLIMCTEQGTIKKTLLEAYSRPRQNGIIAITVHEGDRLLDVALTNGDNDIIIASSAGRAVRFNETGVRPMGRTAAGVRGINLNDPANKVIGMVCINREDAQLLVISENGYGKRSPVEDYRVTKRGGKGVSTMNATEKVGKLVAIRTVTEQDDMMIITRNGITIRMSVTNIRQTGRNTQGVKLIRLNSTDEISSVTRILKEEEDEVLDGTLDPNVVVDTTTDEIIDDEAGETPTEETDEV
jgi:DNA gyrase subunit A